MKITEDAINLDCKMGGGYIRLNANFAKKERRVLTDTRRGVQKASSPGIICLLLPPRPTSI